MSYLSDERIHVPFNGPIEIGLRALTVLNEAFPATYSVQRLVIFDYLIVHSDDLPDGPNGLHPKTPYRGSELLVRRKVLQEGLRLYQSRGLLEQCFEQNGLFFAATERSGSFLDVLSSEYVQNLRQRAIWLVSRFTTITDSELEQIILKHVGEWGAEFTMESLLWESEEDVAK
jgi:hypothetical protein